MKGSLHRDLIQDPSTALQAGSVLILRQVEMLCFISFIYKASFYTAHLSDTVLSLNMLFDGKVTIGVKFLLSPTQ